MFQDFHQVRKPSVLFRLHRIQVHIVPSLDFARYCTSPGWEVAPHVPLPLHRKERHARALGGPQLESRSAGCPTVDPEPSCKAH